MRIYLRFLLHYDNVTHRILLDLPHATVSANKQYSQFPPASSTQEAISFLYAWSAERYQLTDALKALKNVSLQVFILLSDIMTC